MLEVISELFHTFRYLDDFPSISELLGNHTNRKAIQEAGLSINYFGYDDISKRLNNRMWENLNTFLDHMIPILIFHEDKPVVHDFFHELLLFKFAIDDKFY